MARGFQEQIDLGDATILPGFIELHGDLVFQNALMLHLTGISPLELFRTATSKAGAYLSLAPLWTLTPGAPADLIAVRGNPFEHFKALEYPDLVISGGRVVVKKF
ncbi:MAG: hypothetical protein ACREYF_17320 [Gammaproteobacteria bacterium]